MPRLSLRSLASKTKSTFKTDSSLGRPTGILHVRVRKIELSRDPRSSLPAFDFFVVGQSDEHPWGEKSKITTSACHTSFNVVLRAVHDFLDHLPYARFRQFNNQDPIGETYAGQIPHHEQYLSRDDRQNVGLVANVAANQQEKTEEGSVKEALKSIFEKLYQESVPINTKLDVIFKIPAPDIAVDKTKGEFQDRVSLKRSLPNDLIPGSRKRLKEKYTELSLDPVYEKTLMHEEGRDTRVVFIKKHPSSQLREIHKFYFLSSEGPSTVEEIATTEANPIDGVKYFSFQRKDICWSEGQKKLSNSPYRLLNDGTREYTIFDPGNENKSPGEQIFMYDETPNRPSGSSGTISHTRRHPFGGETVFTGRPYREPTIQSVSFSDPSLPGEERESLETAAGTFKERYADWQARQKEIYQRGYLLPNDDLSPFSIEPVTLDSLVDSSFNKRDFFANNERKKLQKKVERADEPFRFKEQAKGLMDKLGLKHKFPKFPPPPAVQTDASVIAKMTGLPEHLRERNASVESFLEKNPEEHTSMSWIDIEKGIEIQAQERPRILP